MFRGQSLNFAEPDGCFAAGRFIASNKPFKVETASGRVFEVPQRDFVSFSTGKTALFISYEENGAERFAIVSTAHHHCRDGSGLRFETSYRR